MGFPGLDALRGAGYRTAYLSPATTRHFCLRELLRQTGFDPVIDRAAFTPHPRDPDHVSDYVLLDQGAQAARGLLAT